RQRRTALVREAYIVATNQNCQQSSTMFLNFLRQKFGAGGLPQGNIGVAKKEPYCRRIAVRHQGQQRRARRGPQGAFL
ncbi:hypothetical protein, partial [Mesorhizobium sp. M0078]|uniref:hypothetical protein n=1 Tax=unclassified Mesorhizobium TaxID=325217 RepID=UPI00333BBB62